MNFIKLAKSKRASLNGTSNSISEKSDEMSKNKNHFTPCRRVGLNRKKNKNVSLTPISSVNNEPLNSSRKSIDSIDEDLMKINTDLTTSYVTNPEETTDSSTRTNPCTPVEEIDYSYDKTSNKNGADKQAVSVRPKRHLPKIRLKSTSKLSFNTRKYTDYHERSSLSEDLTDDTLSKTKNGDDSDSDLSNVLEERKGILTVPVSIQLIKCDLTVSEIKGYGKDSDRETGKEENGLYSNSPSVAQRKKWQRTQAETELAKTLPSPRRKKLQVKKQEADSTEVTMTKNPERTTGSVSWRRKKPEIKPSGSKKVTSDDEFSAESFEPKASSFSSRRRKLPVKKSRTDSVSQHVISEDESGTKVLEPESRNMSRRQKLQKNKHEIDSSDSERKNSQESALNLDSIPSGEVRTDDGPLSDFENDLFVSGRKKMSENELQPKERRKKLHGKEPETELQLKEVIPPENSLTNGHESESPSDLPLSPHQKFQEDKPVSEYLKTSKKIVGEGISGQESTDIYESPNDLPVLDRQKLQDAETDTLNVERDNHDQLSDDANVSKSPNAPDASKFADDPETSKSANYTDAYVDDLGDSKSTDEPDAFKSTDESDASKSVDLDASKSESSGDLALSNRKKLRKNESGSNVKEVEADKEISGPEPGDTHTSESPNDLSLLSREKLHDEPEINQPDGKYLKIKKVPLDGDKPDSEYLKTSENILDVDISGSESAVIRQSELPGDLSAVTSQKARKNQLDIKYVKVKDALSNEAIFGPVLTNNRKSGSPSDIPLSRRQKARESQSDSKYLKVKNLVSNDDFSQELANVRDSESPSDLPLSLRQKARENQSEPNYLTVKDVESNEGISGSKSQNISNSESPSDVPLSRRRKLSPTKIPSELKALGVSTHLTEQNSQEETESFMTKKIPRSKSLNVSARRKRQKPNINSPRSKKAELEQSERLTDSSNRKRVMSDDESLSDAPGPEPTNSIPISRRRKRKKSGGSKHRHFLSKPSTSQQRHDDLNFDSDSDDDFVEKPRRNSQSSQSIKNESQSSVKEENGGSQDTKKVKKLKKNIAVDEMNRLDHIRIAENKSYTIVHRGNSISYVKSRDNDVNFKTTESDDNQQTASSNVSASRNKSMILERKNYLQSGISLTSIFDNLQEIAANPQTRKNSPKTATSSQFNNIQETVQTQSEKSSRNLEEMDVSKLKEEITTAQLRVKQKRENLESLKRISIYKKSHNLEELRSLTLQMKQGCQEALIDLNLLLKQHSDVDFNMGTLLSYLQIPNELVGYKPEEDNFV